MRISVASRERWPWFVLAVTTAHLLFAYTTMGVRAEHLAGDIGLAFFAWLGPRGRRFTKLFFPIWLTAITYDATRLMLNWRGPIHVDDLYYNELKWFGINLPEGRKILPDFFLTRTTPILDLVCGFAYVFYLVEPFLLFLWFLTKKPERARRLAWAFLAANLMAIATYLLYPAAPPWYVQQYGLGPARLDVPPSPAGAAAFDDLTGLRWFHEFYSRSPNVFGAMPSMHAAYPILALCAVLGLGSAWLIWGTGAFAILVGFSAVYLRHHYVMDVLCGWVYAFGASGLVYTADRLWHRSPQPVPAPEMPEPGLDHAVPAIR